MGRRKKIIWCTSSITDKESPISGPHCSSVCTSFLYSNRSIYCTWWIDYTCIVMHGKETHAVVQAGCGFCTRLHEQHEHYRLTWGGYDDPDLTQPHHVHNISTPRDANGQKLMAAGLKLFTSETSQRELPNKECFPGNITGSFKWFIKNIFCREKCRCGWTPVLSIFVSGQQTNSQPCEKSLIKFRTRVKVAANCSCANHSKEVWKLCEKRWAK